MTEKIPKKRGRKSKAKNTIISGNGEKPPPRKRGRKPKGGKIITPPPAKDTSDRKISNIILHLKCNTSDLSNNFSNLSNEIQSFNFNSSMTETCQPVNQPHSLSSINENNDEQDVSKIIHEKLKNLQLNLHINNISDKKSACFWCSHGFDNPPIHIPKFLLNDSYHVYGCFCSPECAVAHLMEENIDSSTKFERYHLLNQIYTKVYDFNKNIKPAPNPFYTLDKFYGNLTISEYRKLLAHDRLLFIVDKPLTRILPELHEDNSDFLLKTKGIPSGKLRIKKRNQKNSKSSIVYEKFGSTA